MLSMKVGVSEGGRKKVSGRWLWLVLIALIVVIFGLATAIVYFERSGVNLENNEDSMSQEALEYKIRQEQITVEEKTAVVDEILNRIENEDGYNLQDAEEDFRIAIANSDGEKKFYIEMAYAAFLYDYYEDFGRALAVLDGMAEFVEDGWRNNYYAAYVNLYYRVGDDEKVREEKYKRSGGDGAESD